MFDKINTFYTWRIDETPCGKYVPYYIRVEKYSNGELLIGMPMCDPLESEEQAKEQGALLYIKKYELSSTNKNSQHPKELAR